MMLNLAFEIGFDHYRFNLPLDIARFPDQYRQAIRGGFEAARLQQASRKKPDLFTKKLLSIRDRSLIKGLRVTITVDDLRREFGKTQGVCPVTNVPFTFAESDMTDWSVDRINNDQGYCPDNIVIVSVVVNQAKGAMDLAGIIKTALAHRDGENELLSSREWLRMAQFYFDKLQLTKPLSFCRLLGDTQALYDQLVFLQLFHNQRDKSQRFLKQLAKYTGNESIRKAAKLASKRVYHRRDIDPDVLYGSPKLYSTVQSFIRIINSHSKEFDPLLMNCLFA